RRKSSESKNSLVPDSVSNTVEILDDISEVNLKRRLGLVSGVCFIVGTIIGSGIFISPKSVLQNTESVGLCMIIWVLCGVLAMLTSLAYAELGTMFPKCGADYIYFLETFGGIPAFLFVWMNSVIQAPGANVIKAMTFAEYIAKLMSDDCGTPEVIKKLIAASVLLAVGITNCISVRLAARFQVFFTAAKVLALVIVSIGGIVLICGGTFGALVTGFEGSTTSSSDVVFAFYGGMFAYDGWKSLNFVVEELENPYVILFAAAREEHLPAIISYIHIRTFIPTPSVIITTIISLLMLIPGNIGSLINFLGFTNWIIYSGVMVCLLVLRYKRKDMCRPVKIPIFIPIIVLLVALYLVVVPLVMDPKIEFLYAGLFVAASLTLYIPLVHFKLRIPGMNYVTALLQLFLEVAPTSTDTIDVD
ncbi:hypothetical protein ScPMuIL_001352, partial [Solemya velum]